MIIIDDVLIDKKYDSKNAGSKARNDINQIFKQEKLITVKNNYESKFISYLKFLCNLCKINRTQEILLQYPLYDINPTLTKWIYKAISKKNTILLIHDINSLRYTPNDINKIKEEVKTINKFKVVISHNKKMTNWLKENGVVSNIIDLRIFDYLGDGVANQDRKYDITYAGNLLFEKSKFLYQAVEANPSLNFEFFGVGFQKDIISAGNYIYEGSKNPEELLSSFHSKFGLIWDGESLEGCTNVFGNYLRYNNPHKLSLYISANLPVITWSQAAIADFVKSKGIGIIIDDLKNLDSVLNNITKDEYEKMVENVQKISVLLKQGYFIKTAVNKAKESFLL